MSDFSGQSDMFGAETTLGSVIEYGLLLNPVTMLPALVAEGASALFAPDDPSVVGQAADAAGQFAAPESPFSQPEKPAEKPLIPTWLKVSAGITGLGIIGVSGVIVLTGIARKLHLI